MALESSKPRRKPRSQRARQGRRYPISTYLDGDLFDRLVQLADANERTVSAEVRLALRSHVEKAEA
jgi:hypothetical protein